MRHIVGGRPLTTPGSIGHCFISPRRDNRVYVLTYVLNGGNRVFFPGLNRERVLAFSSVYSRCVGTINYRGGRFTASRRTGGFTSSVAFSGGSCPIICFGDSAANRGTCRRFCISNRGVGVSHFYDLKIVRRIIGQPVARVSTFFARVRGVFTRPSFAGRRIIVTVGHFVPGFRRRRGKGGLSRGVWLGQCATVGGGTRVYRFVRRLFKARSFIPLDTPGFVKGRGGCLGRYVSAAFISDINTFISHFRRSVTICANTGHAMIYIDNAGTLRVTVLLINMRHSSRILARTLAFVTAYGTIDCVKTCPIFVSISGRAVKLSPQTIGT